MPPLKNARQERFAQNILAGMTQTQAAGDAGYSLNSAVVQGSQLLTNPTISSRVAELKQSTATEGILTVIERRQRLTQFATEDIQGPHGPNRQSNIAAIAELNKMGGNYEPAKVALTDPDGNPIEQRTIVLVLNHRDGSQKVIDVSPVVKEV